VTIDPAIAATLRAALALLFLVAATHKLRDPARFRATLAAYRLVPAAMAPAVVAAELGVAAALVVPGVRVPALAAAAALLAVYAGAVAVNLARGRTDLDCGCAGPAARRPIDGTLVVRNGVVAAAALAGMLPVAARPVGAVDVLTIVGATAALAALWSAADRLAALRPVAARLRSGR